MIDWRMTINPSITALAIVGIVFARSTMPPARAANAGAPTTAMAARRAVMAVSRAATPMIAKPMALMAATRTRNPAALFPARNPAAMMIPSPAARPIRPRARACHGIDPRILRLPASSTSDAAMRAIVFAPATFPFIIVDAMTISARTAAMAMIP